MRQLIWRKHGNDGDIGGGTCKMEVEAQAKWRWKWWNYNVYDCGGGGAKTMLVTVPL